MKNSQNNNKDNNNNTTNNKKLETDRDCWSWYSHKRVNKKDLRTWNYEDEWRPSKTTVLLRSDRILRRVLET